MKRLLLLLLLTLGAVAPVRAFPQYYDIADNEKAQAEPTQRHLPLAWMGVELADLKTPDLSNVDALSHPSDEATEGSNLSQNPTALAPDPVTPPVAPAQTDSATAQDTGDSNDNTASTATTSSDPADEGGDDMSPDEIALWNWCKQNGVYVAIGVGLVLLALRVAGKPAE